MNPMAQMIMPLCQNLISGMMPKPKLETDFLKPLSIQLDEDFAEMADRYFDNVLDGRIEMSPALEKLLMKYGCQGCGSESNVKPAHHEPHEAQHSDEALHRVYMAAIDKISQFPARADEIINEHFVGLTDEERRVLKESAKGHVLTKLHAAAVNMSEPLYISRLENVMTKIKKE